ncbi:hypothetical protein GCM10009545_03000 [Saccharopolyspora thermophila]|uniref:Uncharacterized protein n=1 Tax=Saccharopolyspora thermophila TaxID=89367 RepID=A0ABN1BSC2_9PSEU
MPVTMRYYGLIPPDRSFEVTNVLMYCLLDNGSNAAMEEADELVRQRPCTLVREVWSCLQARGGGGFPVRCAQVAVFAMPCPTMHMVDG